MYQCYFAKPIEPIAIVDIYLIGKTIYKRLSKLFVEKMFK